MREELEMRLSQYMDEIELDENIADDIFSKIEVFTDEDIQSMLYWSIDDFTTWFDLW